MGSFWTPKALWTTKIDLYNKWEYDILFSLASKHLPCMASNFEPQLESNSNFPSSMRLSSWQELSFLHSLRKFLARNLQKETKLSCLHQRSKVAQTNEILQHKIHAYNRNLHMYKMSMSYCTKKSIHFLTSHLHSDFCYSNSSSCESSFFTSIMESLVQPSPIFLSSCCMCLRWLVGFKVQQWETSCTFFWKMCKTYAPSLKVVFASSATCMPSSSSISKHHG